tara:strand:+ start:965 stop:3100 length:2136 start_codon:yes stop_codon:yes gene_type:complete
MREQLISWRTAAEIARKDHEATLRVVDLRTKERDAARHEAASNAEAHVTARMELNVSKCSAAETERAIILNKSNKFAALLAEIGTQKHDADQLRRQISDIRQELLSLRQQLTILSKERDEAAHETLSARREAERMGQLLTVKATSEKTHEFFGKTSKVFAAEKERTAALRKQAHYQTQLINERHARKRLENALVKAERRLHIEKRAAHKTIKVRERTAEEKSHLASHSASIVSLAADTPIITRKLACAKSAKIRTDHIFKALRLRCLFLEHQLQIAASVRTCWQRERTLLLASIRDAHMAIQYLLAGSRMTAKQKPLDLRGRAEKQLEHIYYLLRCADAKVLPSRDFTNRIIAARRAPASQKLHDAVHWDLAPADPTDIEGVGLVERLGFRGLASHIADIALSTKIKMGNENAEISPANLGRRMRTAVAEEIIANKLAEVATTVRCVDSARKCVEPSVSFDAVAVTQTKEMAHLFAARDETEVSAKWRAALQYICSICSHTTKLRGTHLVHLELSSLYLDDNSFLQILHLLLATNKKQKSRIRARGVALHDRQVLPATQFFHMQDMLGFPALTIPNLLSHLILHHNALGDLAASSIAMHLIPFSPVLANVDLQHNRISRVGMLALVRGVNGNPTVLSVTSPAGWGYLLDGHMGDSVICGWREHGRGAIKPLLVLKQLRENTPGIDDQNPKMLTGTLPLVVDLSNNGLRRRT